MSAGTGLSAIGAVMQDRENADMLFRAETTLKDDYIKFERDVRERKGQNAWGATKDAEKWFTDQEKKHSDILQNDTQRRLFNQSFTKLRQSATSSISQHEAGERRKSLEESAQASIVGSINLAAGAAADMQLGPTLDAEGNAIPGSDPIGGVKSDVIKRVQVLSDINGWTSERKTMEEAKYLTSLHSQVLQSLVVANPAKAKEYYKTYKEEINGSERDGIEKVIQEGTLREVAQTATDEIMGKGLSLGAALNYARSKYQGHEEDEITRRIKERFSEREAALNLGQKHASDAAWKVLTNGGGRDNIPPALWNALPGEEQRQVLNYLDARTARGDNAGKDDIENLAKVETMIEQGDITKKEGLAKYEPFFSKSTLKTLGNKIDKRGEVKPSEMRRVFEERKGVKVNPAKMGEGDLNEWMAFQGYLLENVKETKRPEDIEVWADRWFMRGRGKNDAAFTNDPNTYGEARTKGRKDFVISTPEGVAPQVDQTLAILSKNGVPIPKDRKLARDEFYTTHALEADRWAMAHEVPSSPELTAAYALLKQNKKPITPANLDYIMRQLKK
jgi:predicted Fe-S protein YdhL (DUF1289 family)